MIDTDFKLSAEMHIEYSFHMFKNEDDRYNSLGNEDKFRELFENSL